MAWRARRTWRSLCARFLVSRSILRLTIQRTQLLSPSAIRSRGPIARQFWRRRPMIALIRGTVYRRLDSAVIVLVGDIGYEVRVVDPTMFEVGEEVELRTYHVVKEDRQELYGFVEQLDYEVFADLVEHVPGVGAKTALNLLRAIPASRLIEAVREQSVGLLTSAPGIGKKNAERILNELRPIVTVSYTHLRAPETRHDLVCR